MNSSIKKAFDILAFLVDNPEKMSLREMSGRLNMNKTTLFRFLTTLESIGVLYKKNDQYFPGFRLFEMGNRVPVKQLVVDKVMPFLEELTAEVNETVNMGQFTEGKVLYLAKSESARSLQLRSRVGDYISVHSSALGKSIMSILPRATMERALSGIQYEVRTNKTITEQSVLLQHIGQTQEDGFSTDLEEMEEGLNCVAVPLPIKEMEFFGGISCSGPTVRFTPERLKELAGKLQETSEKIQKQFAQ